MRANEQQFVAKLITVHGREQVVKTNLMDSVDHYEVHVQFMLRPDLSSTNSQNYTDTLKLFLPPRRC